MIELQWFTVEKTTHSGFYGKCRCGKLSLYPKNSVNVKCLGCLNTYKYDKEKDAWVKYIIKHKKYTAKPGEPKTYDPSKVYL